MVREVHGERGLKMQKWRVTTVVLILIYLASAAWADGSLQIVSTDESVQWNVSLDNRDIQFSQGMRIWLESGLHRLVATAVGYQRVDEPVRIVDGECTQIALTAEPPAILHTSSMQNVQVSPSMSTLIIVGTIGNEAFAIDRTACIAPSSLSMSVGSHVLTSGAYTWEVTLSPEVTTFVRIDAKKGAIEQFTVTDDQFNKMNLTNYSYDRMFSYGYRQYGFRTFWNLRNTLIVLGLFTLFVCYVIFRFSMHGRVQCALWKRRSFVRTCARLSRKDPKQRRPAKEKSLLKQTRKLRGMDGSLENRITNNRKRLERLPAANDKKSVEKRKHLTRKIKKYIRLRKKIADELA